MIIVSFISKNGLSDQLLAQNMSNIFTKNSTKLFELTTFPNHLNELPLLFSIFSNLSQTRSTELLITNDDDENKISSLFDKYFDANDEIFKICSDQINKKQSKYIKGDKIVMEDSDGGLRRLFRNIFNDNDDDVEDKVNSKKKNF